MSLLSFTALAQSFGAFDVFSGLTANLPNDGKVGLVGPNGIGKTSLLLILAGLAQPVSGSVHLARGRRIGYLRQEAVEAFAARENSVYAEMLTVFAGLREQQERLHELEAAMAAGDHSAELLERYGREQELFDLAGGYDYDLRIQQTLTGLGFGPDEWDQPLSVLSGGQKTRALLARLLLEQPDLLILDEPTNHLDAQAVEWLEHALYLWPGALLVVSHDRWFLDNVVDTIWEMSRSGLEVYSGNYSAYLRQRQERWERHQALFEATKERLQQELEYIKHGYARESTHNIAQGKLRRLSRELAAIEHVGLMAMQGVSWLRLGVGAVDPLTISEAAQRIRALQPPRTRPPQLRLTLPTAHAGGPYVLRTQKLRVGYPGKPLVEASEVQLLRGECAALIGPNGSGKTTLLRTLLGEVPPLAGTVSFGPKHKVGYFAQAHDGLDPERTVLAELLWRRSLSEEGARAYLAQYLFHADDVYKRISALSGGERARMALAMLALEGANVLLLDEPTNHLDINAQEELQQALESFHGTILLVSHDRYLVDRLATQIWAIEAGRLRVFRGRYSEFVAKTDDRRRTTDDGRKRQAPANGKRSTQHAAASNARMS
jgi:ATP-binding cassette subfamily F protein 3